MVLDNGCHKENLLEWVMADGVSECVPDGVMDRGSKARPPIPRALRCSPVPSAVGWKQWRRTSCAGYAPPCGPLWPPTRDLLVGWLQDPEVYRWWGGRPLTRDEIVRSYLGDREPDVVPFIIEHGAVAIGYIQYWIADVTSGGLDMFLVPGARGQGLGPDAARALVRYLFNERHWRQVTVDPAVDNASAIRAWHKAGFRTGRTLRDSPAAPVRLMEITRPSRGE